MCNFIEGDGTGWEKGTKLIYRHYATLYFVFVVDSSESELGILDLIQTFVEVLDTCFRNVCELDLIFNFDKVHYVLDEIVQGGMVWRNLKKKKPPLVLIFSVLINYHHLLGCRDSQG